jgi:hypothetical protein
MTADIVFEAVGRAWEIVAIAIVVGGFASLIVHGLREVE